MATILRTEERNGDIIAIYESGAEYNQSKGRLVKAPPKAQITPENSNEYKRKRQEKAARLLRERIVQAHNRGDMEPVKGSAEAFAESGALLYEEIVLDKNAYPRDRMDVWEKLGKYGGVLPSDIRKQDDTAQAVATAAAAGAAVATVLERVLRDVRQAQERGAVEGRVVDVNE